MKRALIILAWRSRLHIAGSTSSGAIEDVVEERATTEEAIPVV
jgi:hypothetical protein